ncbi:hypothetical protein Tco_0524652 [Tanacetum coccineum]
MQEPKKPVKVKGKDQIGYDADMAKRLKAELDEELSVEERARLLMEFIAARKKLFTAKRAKEQRNKPPTKAEQRKKLRTYMKHMVGYKDKYFKGKSFDAIMQMFDKAYKQVNDFVPMDTESSRKKAISKKRAGERPSKESAKRQKIEDDAEKTKLKACLEIVPGDDSAINIESLATKYPIVDWKTHIIAEDKMYYQIIRADGSTKYYKIFSAMLDDFDRQDVSIARKDKRSHENSSRRIIKLEIWDTTSVGLRTLLNDNKNIRRFETAVRLQEEFDEKERQKIARVHEAARSFSKVEWEDIRARVEAFKELVQRLQTKEREKYSEDDQAKILQLKRLSFEKIKDLFETTMRRANTFVPMETEIRRGVPELVANSSKAAVTESTEAAGSKRVSEEELVLEEGMNIEALDDLVKLWSLVQERFNSIEPTKDKEIEIWVELKRLFEPDADDELWKSHKHIHDITWRLYDTCGVHHVSTKDGIDIYMLVKREYHLSRGILTQMLVARLLVEQNNEMSRELLRKIFMQIERP